MPGAGRAVAQSGHVQGRSYRAPAADPAFVAVNTWLTRARSTDWNNSLWVKVYPINADGSDVTAQYIAGLGSPDFAEIEAFAAREAARWGRGLEQPVRIEIGAPVTGQPPLLDRNPHMLAIAWWSLRMRWWAGQVTDDQDRIEPDVSIFVRYHDAVGRPGLDDSVGVQKGMFGIVNAYTGRRYGATNNVIIAHELLHTLGATDKYDTRDRPAAGSRRARRCRPPAALSAGVRRDHGRPHRARGRRCGDSTESAVRSDRRRDGRRNRPDWRLTQQISPQSRAGAPGTRRAMRHWPRAPNGPRAPVSGRSDP